jgi:tetratricopeptide (TPR) repeat protein
VRIPQPPAVFLGRQAELDELASALVRAPVALLFGVAGVGKSALAFAFAARWAGPVVYRRMLEDDTPEHVALDLLREVGAAAPAGKMRVESDLSALGERLDELGALLVLDDLHHFPATERASFLQLCAESLVRARVIATSRERIGSPAEGPERLELRVEGLDEPSAQQVWSALDRLYGPSEGFQPAWRRAHGNPFLLRRWHAGAAFADDPVATAIRDLGSDERRLAAALAVSGVRLPVGVLAHLVPGERGTRAIRALTTRLVIEIDGNAECALHDLFRAALLDELGPDEATSVHADLAGALADADLPVVERAREVCRHLLAANRHEQVGEYLLEHSADLVRLGGARELLRGFDAIPPERRSMLVQIERVRTLGRVLDLERAYDELARLVEIGAEPRVPLQLAFGQLASGTCHLEEGQRAIAAVLAAADLSWRRRMLAQTAWAILRAHAGAFDEARAFLAEAIHGASDPVHVGNLHLTSAFTYWIEGRDDESETPLRRALAHLAEAPPSFRASFAAPMMLAGVAAAAGRFAEAEDALQAARSALREDDEQRPSLELRAVQALVSYERGQRHEAIEQWRAVHESMDRAGYRLATLWVECLMGRAMLELGWRTEALSLLRDAEARARAWGMVSMERMAARTQAHDPLAALDDGEIDERTMPKSPARAVRWRSFAALRAAMAGKDTRARRLLEANAPLGVGIDHALDRAMANLAEAVFARRAGDAAAAAAAQQRAVSTAERGAVDGDLVATLDATMRGLTVVSVPPAAPATGAAPPPSGEMIVDRRKHEIRTPAGRVSLRRSPMLRRLLYALADRAGEAVTREDLALKLWNATYHPLVHDNAILVNVSRLRAALVPVGVAVVWDESGYRLELVETSARS